jgi:hypothetical protein
MSINCKAQGQPAGTLNTHQRSVQSPYLKIRWSDDSHRGGMHDGDVVLGNHLEEASHWTVGPRTPMCSSPITPSRTPHASPCPVFPCLSSMRAITCCLDATIFPTHMARTRVRSTAFTYTPAFVAATPGELLRMYNGLRYT